MFSSTQSIKRYIKLLDISVLIILIVLLIGFIAFDYELLGLEQIIHLPQETEVIFEIAPWCLFGLLLFDLYLKYKILGNFNNFLSYHWHDILMTLLIPILLPLKFYKPAIKSYKLFKSGKYGLKFAQKVNKIKYLLHHEK